MIDSGQQIVLAVPEGQRFTCRRCGWCCKGWRIEVTPAERDRLLAHDWAAVSPRFRGVGLFEEHALPLQKASLIQTAQIGGRCIFLDADNLCVIHGVLGEEAKPAGCRRFPLRLGKLPEGVLVGADFACMAVVSNEGAPISELPMPASECNRASDGSGRGWERIVEPRPLMAPGVSMVWSSYLEVEHAILEILGMTGYPISARIAAAGELISAAAAAHSRGRGAGSEGAREWLSAEMCDGYSRSFLAAAFSRSSVPRPIGALASLIGDVETPHSSTSGRGSAAIGYAMAVAAGVGPLYLSMLDATVDLGTAGSVRCELDSDEFDDCLSRFVTGYLMRKSLLGSPDLTAGWEYLGICLSLVQWYARVSAALSGRTRAILDDVITGIQVVEKSYVA